MTPIFHITHVRNLPGIIATGGLRCDRRVATEAPPAVSIAHQHIKQRRAARAVQKLDGSPVSAGGHLCDYVPFYFAPRSPMLYSIHRGQVEGYREGQRPILHLELAAEDLAASGRPWAFTDGHADMGLSDFFANLGDLAREVDWTVMASRYWHDTTAEPDRKRRRQAEFLVHERVPWSAVQRIGVIDQEVQREVDLILRDASHQPVIAVQPDWYY